MKFKILDYKSENGSKCILLKNSLRNYIDLLPENYNSFDIQRSIVSNIYLDRLIDTILSKGHIPTITLISNEIGDVLDKSEIDLGEFKILDGLQRTHRIKIIDDTRALFLNEIKNYYKEMSEFQLKRKFRDELSKIGSSGNILSAICKFYDKNGEEELNNCFTENYQWFEVWTGLTPDKEVKKMLVLNAGHKPVNIKHQLEILFQNLLPRLEEVSSGNVEILREKYISTTAFSKQRDVGKYHFSHLISSLVSFAEKKPVTTTTSFIDKIQNDDDKLEEFLTNFSYEFLDSFIKSIYSIDVAANKIYGDVGTKWIGREVSLVALFGAIGNYATGPQEVLELSIKIANNFNLCNLYEYEECRNNVDLAKVNIGNINKKYIFNAFEDIIDNNFSKKIDWKIMFQEGEK